jgi:hypothetical protein
MRRYAWIFVALAVLALWAWQQRTPSPMVAPAASTSQAPARGEAPRALAPGGKDRDDAPGVVACMVDAAGAPTGGGVRCCHAHSASTASATMIQAYRRMRPFPVWFAGV